MAKWAPAYEHLMLHRAGYSFDLHHLGGEVYNGISRSSYPSWIGWDIVDRNRKASDFPGGLDKIHQLQLEVESYYRDLYWLGADLELLNSQLVANSMLELCAEFGIWRTVTYLQRTCNALNRGESIAAHLVVDGVLGERTLRATNRIALQDEENVIKLLHVHQGSAHLHVVESHATGESQLRRWLRRVRVSAS